MGMSKKDFIALADELRPIFSDDAEFNADSREEILNSLCAFMRGQNPMFKEDRWRSYLANPAGTVK